jgi:hypothetical protein
MEEVKNRINNLLTPKGTLQTYQKYANLANKFPAAPAALVRVSANQFKQNTSR